jgi:hypothetical protein
VWRGAQDPHAAAGSGRVLGDGGCDKAADQSDDGGASGVDLQSLFAAGRAEDVAASCQRDQQTMPAKDHRGQQPVRRRS